MKEWMGECVGVFMKRRVVLFMRKRLGVATFCFQANVTLVSSTQLTMKQWVPTLEPFVG